MIKKVILLFLLGSSMAFSQDNKMADLYLKAFGFVPDKKYELKIFINGKDTKKVIKMVSRGLKTNYLYNLSIISPYFKKSISLEKEIILKDIPWKYKLDTEKETFNILVEEYLLKPWKYKINDTFKAEVANSSYYHIPISASIENGNEKVNVGLNYYNKNVYMQVRDRYFRFGYYNFRFGNIYSSKYANLNKVAFEGIQYFSKFEKEKNNNFSSLFIENSSIVEIFDGNRRVKKLFVEKGTYDFSDADSLNYKIKITDMTNNEVKYIENYSFEKSFDYDIAIGENSLSSGIKYNIFEIALFKDLERKNFAFRIGNNQKRVLFKRLYFNDDISSFVEFKYHNFKLSYKENQNQVWDPYINEFQEERGKQLSTSYKYDKLYFEVGKNIIENNFNYSLSWLDDNYKITYKKDDQNYVGFSLSAPLWKEKRNSIKFNYNSNKVNNIYSDKVGLEGSFYNNNNDLLVKVEKADDIINYDIFNKYRNKYADIHLRYLENGNVYSNKSGYIFTNIIGNDRDFTLTNEKPMLGDSIWFVKNSYGDIPNIYKINQNSKFTVKDEDFNVVLKKNSFNLKHKNNSMGYINLEKSFNVVCKLNDVLPLELFSYDNKNSFVGLDKKIYLNDVENRVYVLKFKDKTKRIEVKNGECK